MYIDSCGSMNLSVTCDTSIQNKKKMKQRNLLFQVNKFCCLKLYLRVYLSVFTVDVECTVGRCTLNLCIKLCKFRQFSGWFSNLSSLMFYVIALFRCHSLIGMLKFCAYHCINLYLWRQICEKVHLTVNS